MSEPSPTIGYLAQVACTWEVLARKAGNVCPGREFPDLTVNDFLISAAAIAPVLNDAPHHSLGVTILRAIEATWDAVDTNTNLGIVLLLAPLASVPLTEPLLPGLLRVLASTTVEDARNVYAAIRLAKPGGLGKAQEQDVHDEPTLPLREVMGLAKDRDTIAAQYVTDFQACRNLAARIAVQTEHTGTVERAVVEAQLYMLAHHGDDLVVRKMGADAVGPLRYLARKRLDKGLDTQTARTGFREFDAWLRTDGHVRNPGTTADLIAAALFIALRDQAISLSTPFAWDSHPFAKD